MIRPLSSFAVFNVHRRSLIRGNFLVLGSFALSFLLSGFPRSRPTLLMLIPTILAFIGTYDTFRCLRPQHNLHHAGIVLCLVMDMLAICLILFFLFFPYLY
ncbi:MAG TPA: permease [Acidobacteriaceae bacterium]